MHLSMLVVRHDVFIGPYRSVSVSAGWLGLGFPGKVCRQWEKGRKGLDIGWNVRLLVGGEETSGLAT